MDEIIYQIPVHVHTAIVCSVPEALETCSCYPPPVHSGIGPYLLRRDSFYRGDIDIVGNLGVSGRSIRLGILI